MAKLCDQKVDLMISPGHRLLAWLLPLTACLGFYSSLSAAPVTKTGFSLLPAVQARFDDRGNLSLVTENGSMEILRLEVAGDFRKPSGSAKVFSAQTSEGADHGLRGFSRGADDDADGLVDEDPLDNRDNDGDGLVDEDYAAISDAMLVWDDETGGVSLHREYYHWSGGFLNSALFFALTARTAPFATQTLVLEAGLPWVLTQVEAYGHDPAGRPQARHSQALVTGVASRDGVSPEIWIGLMALGQESANRLNSTDLGRVEAALDDVPMLGVVIVARSWRQLSNRLCEAEAVYRGVADALTAQQAHWIVPPRCSLCRQAPDPQCRWRPEGHHGGSLILSKVQGSGHVPDPDLLVVAGQALGSPEAISWVGANGEPQILPWSRYLFQDLLRGRPAPGPLGKSIPGLRDHDHPLNLTFAFNKTPPPLRDLETGDKTESSATLTCRGLDGRGWHTELLLDLPAPSLQTRESAEDDKAGDIADPDHPTLTPSLMLGWPNPFRERIQIRCRVPATSREAFAPSGDLEDPEKTAASWPPLPWGQGEPSVTVKIYSLNGQEIRTLYSGRQGAGEFVIQWDGTDSFGRSVASGPYLCKLQLDSLSLTRRLVYLR